MEAPGKVVTTSILKVEALKEAITEKLVANVQSIAKAKSGRIDWRWTRDGTLEIKVHPEL